MATLRKGGGVVALFWQGKIADPADEAFCEALAGRRFRTIENAASEEISVGWVTSALPTGDEFALEDLDAGAGTWLRMRIDKKVLPKKWLAIHLETEERARGKKLPPRERRELKADIGEKLLPRVLPTINLVDALMFHERKTILLFATGSAVVEAFGKLFFETFALPLDRANPYVCATRAGLDRETTAALERAQPIRWPDVTGGEHGGDRRELPAAVEVVHTDGGEA
ncbi:MAG: recombination-associated protein RdgC [Planctomycetes bacterium]|nr:recombination-associated protein RdgC [Planctomycetota bacterium]